MTNSVQHKLKRVRPPRVAISYDVEIGDAVEKRELPFVGAIIADLAGDNSVGQPKFSERTFVDVDNESINEVMEGISPSLSYTVDNKLSGNDGQINVALNFNSMADFQPENIIQQVEPLKKLFEARQRLNDLSAKLDGNDELDSLLSQIIQNTDEREKIAGELASNSSSSTSKTPDKGSDDNNDKSN